ncbi:DnaJ domain-containing protein [Brasilonema sp. CT11]|nr:DnaJ domain-containing protein [Brasilonema sp. CT11]
MALRFHPSRCAGSEEDFKKITEAYEILSDESKRYYYDKEGLKGLEKFEELNASRWDYLIHGRTKPYPSAPDMYKTVFIPLEEFYSGTVRIYRVHRDVICATCQGSGLVNLQFPL